MIHIGKRVTLQTLCGKPVARRWWVDAAERNTGPTVVTMECLFETVLGWVALPELPPEPGKEAAK